MFCVLVYVGLLDKLINQLIYRYKRILSTCQIQHFCFLQQNIIELSETYMAGGGAIQTQFSPNNPALIISKNMISFF